MKKLIWFFDKSNYVSTDFSKMDNANAVIISLIQETKNRKDSATYSYFLNKKN